MWRFVLLGLILFGGFLRYYNLTPYKIYPDSYVNLITALNIQNFHSVVGFLGKGGMVWPDFFMWSRPGYPLFILLTNLFVGNLERSAVYICFFASIATIPLIFWLGNIVFKSKTLALLAATLVSISFNAIVWSGFIQTEALGVFMMTLYLCLLFYNLNRDTKFADFGEALTGVILALAILTRYEYLLIIIPSLHLIFKQSKNPWVKTANILSSCTLVLVVAFVQLFPIPGTFWVISTQLGDLTTFSLFSIFVVLLFLFISRYRPKNFLSVLENRGKMILSLGLLIFCGLVGLNMLGGFSNQTLNLLGYADFFANDFILGALVVSALIFWAKDSKVIGIDSRLRGNDMERAISFSVISILVLAPVYYRINPEMQRYLVHLLPFLVILATYGLQKIIVIIQNVKISSLKFLAITALTIPLLVQLVISFQGIKQWDNGDWFRSSYDEEVARLFNQRSAGYKLLPQNSLVLVSFPEPYFYVTQMDTYSVTDGYPYIYIDEQFDNREVYLIEDMGMRDIFPSFSQLLDKKLSDYLIDEFVVGENYRFGSYAKPEDRSARVFKLTLKELKDIIFSTHSPSSQ